MVPYDASDHFEQIFLLYFDAGGRSLLIGDHLENCWLATSNSCIEFLLIRLQEEIWLKLNFSSIALFNGNWIIFFIGNEILMGLKNK